MFTFTDSKGELETQTHTGERDRMQLNPCIFFFLLFPLAFSSLLLPGESSLLLPGERVEIFARALHSLIPGHGAWSEAGELFTNVI